MKRVISISMVLVLVLSMFSFVGCKSDSAEIVLIMADVQEGDHPTARASDKFAELVNDRTNGRIKIEVYHGQTLGTEAEQTKQVAVDGIDFARVSTSQLSSYDDDFKAFQALYLYDSEKSMWNVLDSSFGEGYLTSSKLKDNGITGLCWISGGSRNFYNNKKEVIKPTDLGGLKLRVNTDSMFALLEKCGAEGINIAYGDIYNSISAGVIDGAENNWPSYISTDHYKVAKYITVDEHTRIPEMIIASTEALSKLSSEDQQIIRECAKEAGNLQRQWMNDYDSEAIKNAESAGCKVTYLNEAQVKAFQDMATPVNETVNAKYMTIINKIKSLQK